MKSFMYALIVLGLAGCVTLTSSQDTPPQLANLSSSIHQAVMVDPLPSSRATVTAWERNGRGWRQVFKPTAAMVGRNGVAPLNEKREGDGRTPSGIYAIGTAFGYAPAIHTKLPYRQATENDFWVDDVSSPQYNRWVTGKPNASSFEEMRRSDDLYKYGAVIEYNTDPIIPGNGSAIFVHIWRGPDTATAGCVAVPEPQLRSLLKWLDAASQPVIILKSL